MSAPGLTRQPFGGAIPAVIAGVLLSLCPPAQAEEGAPLGRPTRTDPGEYVGGVPLGGLGTGTVELRGDGSFREWQIFNNWGNTPQVALFKYPPAFDLLNAFAAVKVDDRAYVLETHPPEGLPGVKSIAYDGWFPFSNLDFVLADNAPVKVSLEAFGSYVPHHAEESGIPSFGLAFRFRNVSDQPVRVSIAVSLVNPLGRECKEDTLGPWRVTESTRDRAGLAMAALDGVAASITGGPDTADALKSFWTAFASRTQDFASTGQGQRFGQVVTFELAPGEEKAERFVVGWFFPDHRENGSGPLVGHRYEAWSDSAAASVGLFASHFDELRSASARWRDTLRDSTWPDWISRWLCNSQSTLAKTSWWVRDGRFMNYESPACPNSSPVHLIDLADWPLLDAFPEIELDLLRRYGRGQGATGKIFEEFAGPDTKPSVTFLGGRDLYDVNPKFVVEVYHRWRETGDREFLDALWPVVRKAIDYSATHFDALGIGLPSGDHLVSTWDHWDDKYGMSYGGSVWLAGLRAAREIAMVEGDREFAARVQEMSEKCLATMNTRFWNGEFYGMAINRELRQNDLAFCESTYGDAFSRFVGLGPVLPDGRALATLRAIAKYNSQPTPYGIVIAADRSGKMIEYNGDVRSQITTCHSIPAPIALIQQGDENDRDAGLAILRRIYAIGEKHAGGLWNLPHHALAATGERNVDDFPHYLRDRCIWALLKVLNGWRWDAANHVLAVGPVLAPEQCRGPWICPAGYGTLAQTVTGDTQHLTLTTSEGALPLAELDVRSRLGGVTALTARQGAETLAASFVLNENQVQIKFSVPIKLEKGSVLDITLFGARDAKPFALPPSAASPQSAAVSPGGRE